MTPPHPLDRRLLPALLAALLLPACATTGPVARAPSGDAPPPTAVATPPEPAMPDATEATAAAAPETTQAPAPPEVVAATPVATEATGREVFDRIRARLQSPACVDSARARQWQSRYAQHPTTFSRRLADTLPLLDFVVAEAERAGVPGEYVFIPLVESWFEPGAIGRGGPTGMWQMIGSTARNHGVLVGKGYDGRLSPVDSTRAALSYLRTLGDMFDGDWQATVMAYNAGEYRLAGALRRSGQRRVSAAEGVPAGLSQITYDYVSKLQALSCLVAEPQRHGLTLPDDVRFSRLAPVLVSERMGSLEQLAVRAGLDARELRAINPAYRGGRIANGAPRVLLLPLANAPRVAAIESEPAPAPVAAAAIAAGADAPASATHEVRSGDTLSHIARRYGLTLGALRRINRLGNSSRIKPGQVLRLVP